MTFPRNILEGKIRRETEKALLISFTNGRETWIPKSVIQSSFTPSFETTQQFSIAKWFIERSNILLDTSNPNIIGSSGSVQYLKNRLLKKGINGFETFKDIQTFKKNYSTIIANSTNEERDKLNNIIEALKTDEERLIEQVKKKKKELKLSLKEEKEQLMEGELSSRDKKRVKKIDKVLKKKLDKPFKKDIKQIKKTEKEILTREKNIEKEVDKSVKPLRKAHDIIEVNKTFVSGAVGETAAIKELKKLPESYYVLNEAYLHFSNAIYWRKHRQYVKSCKIDHVVVGPTGIFLIETKNWSPQRLQHVHFTPHEQIDRAGYIFFIHMISRFSRKFPVYKIVATLRKLPQIPYEYVEQMAIRDLVNYILEKKQQLDSIEIQKIVDWLRKEPHITNLRLRSFYRVRKKSLFF